MLHNAGFSPRDWEMAPHYVSPISEQGAVVLDFSVLGKLAKQEKANGSFRKTPDGTLATAPLFVDDLPAAFYRINTSYPGFTPNHNTTERETIVVVDGILKLAMNDGNRDEAKDANLENTYYMGEVIELSDEAIAMQAIGLVDPARCLALALYRDHDIQIIPILN